MTSLRQIVKTFKSKKGREVVFRYPQEGDFEQTFSYACDLAEEDTFVELTGKITREDEQKWFKEVLDQVQQGKQIYLTVLVDGKMAGSGEVRIGKYRHSHVGEIGLSLAAQYRDEGIGSELLKILIDQARRLGLRLLKLNCFENNSRSLHVYEKLGFKRAGLIPGAITYKDNYIGEVIMYLPLTK